MDSEFHNARPKELTHRHGDSESPAERDNRVIVTLHQKRLDAVNTAVQLGDKMFLSFRRLRCRDDSYTVVFGIVGIERGSRQKSRRVDNAAPAGVDASVSALSTRKTPLWERWPATSPTVNWGRQDGASQRSLTRLSPTSSAVSLAHSIQAPLRMSTTGTSVAPEGGMGAPDRCSYGLSRANSDRGSAAKHLRTT